ncbi:MAG: D-2-hydroxyacid dehydrogenase [Acidobacteriota bacterium]|nr:D-2-hydroxyacid dehydrogenase [Acidobacteriota bacterium]
MERIVFLERDALKANVRRPEFPHEWQDYAQTAQEQVVERLRGATIAIMNKLSLGEAELAQLPALKFIAVAATGYNMIDLESCERRGITVSNVRGYAVHAVPEHALMLMLALRRNLLAYRADVRGGAWQQATQFCLMNHPIRDLHGVTLGIIGYGALGQAVEKLTYAFGMKILISEYKGAAQARGGRTPFAEVLRASDVITLHAPLVPETRQLIGAAEFEQMKPSAILINAARGGIVDETALIEALTAGRIAGAGIDVLEHEPPRDGNPLLDLDLPNLIVTPHNAWASDQAMQTLADQLVDNLEAFVRGEPINTVTS